MPNKSNIEWTDITWNPVTGCSKLSSGCKNCYAERWANMQQKRGIHQYRDGFEVTVAPNRLMDPYKWSSPKLVFVNSMSDILHESIPSKYIEQIFHVMNDTPQHTYQLLTKRPERFTYISNRVTLTDNIWFGTSIEDYKSLPRAEHLLKIPAKVRFLSIEPLIGPIDKLCLESIQWVIVGGESGAGARVMKPEWVTDILKRCKESNTPFYFKQWGKTTFNPDQTDPTIKKGSSFYSKGGCMIDGKIIRELPI